MGTISTGIKLDESIRDRLQALGERAERSPHWLMKTAINQYLDEQERYWQERDEDMARWKEYQMTGEAVSHGDVTKWLDSIGTDEELPCPR